MQFGPWDVQIVSGGKFRLDGGAMGGPAPRRRAVAKPEWERSPVDCAIAGYQMNMAR